ncbi:type IV fimbrial biogenesis protein,prepilin cysteine protease (C20) PilD [Luminiphilus syltensis NOR5-1B]|uniref:Prepilin leader peptidase/N-methyltransferase n=1 Tax=Luminiphilus syltensis NOR5-1B TaxID=565045 RepID=B8KR39_9GAMM|nr:A24 family peptidase [Luminiphilus syltensis]EED34996.1 type IV fimbrial biogenesis protein,prepilin cysteine protease (C20) PilD [Luminiphilus syltensis NOR5-1B]
MSPLVEHTGFLLLGLALFGATIGSFLNVVIYRLPRMMEQGWRRDCCELLEQEAPEEKPLSLAVPNSQCPHCQAPIKPWQNIPLISYLALRGKCANCDGPISIRYPLVELASALLCVAAGITFGYSLELLGALLLIWASIALTGIDIDTRLLPDSITLPVLWLGLVFNLFGVFTSLEAAVMGAMAGYLILWSVYWLFKLVTGKEGMGYGDFKLLAAFGAWFGWQSLPLIIVLSSFVGAVIGILLVMLKRSGRDIPMPFGPYLAGAGLLFLFYGEQLTARYLEFSGLQ